MNCVSEQCEYVRCKVIRRDGYKYFKSFLVFECALGKNVSYPFIDDHKKDLRCECYKRTKGGIK